MNEIIHPFLAPGSPVDSKMNDAEQDDWNHNEEAESAGNFQETDAVALTWWNFEKAQQIPAVSRFFHTLVGSFGPAAPDVHSPAKPGSHRANGK